MRLAHLLPAVLLCSATVSCEDDPATDPGQYDPNAGYQQGGYQYPPQPGYPQPGYPQPGQPGQPGQPPPPVQPGTPAPTAPAPTAGGGNCTAIPPALAAGASPLLAQLSTAKTAGMRPDSAALAANCQQGQTIEHPFQIQPGRCYAVVGVGVGITELDIQIVLHQPPLPAYVAAQDQDSGPQAVLGGSGNCFKNPLPVGGPAKVIIKATGGSGMVMAQVFSK